MAFTTYISNLLFVVFDGGNGAVHSIHSADCRSGLNNGCAVDFQLTVAVVEPIVFVENLNV